MDPIPLNTVRVSVAMSRLIPLVLLLMRPASDISGAAADARAVLAGTAADTAVVAADARAAFAGTAANTAVAAADVAAVADSAGDLCRRVCRVRHHCGCHVPCSTRSDRRFWL